MTTYYLLPYLFYLPNAILSAIIILVVQSILAETPHDVAFFFRMRSWTDCKSISHLNRTDFGLIVGLMLITFLLTALWSVNTGIIVSVALSLVMVVQNSSSMYLLLLYPVSLGLTH